MKRLLLAVAVLPLLLTGCGGSAAPQTKSADIFAMDTYMNLKATGTDAEAAVSEASDRISALETLLSVTQETSEVYALNHANGAPTPLSAETQALLQTAAEVRAESGGALCISVYPVLRAWGFTTGSYRIPPQAERDALLAYADDAQIQPENGSLTLPDQMQIDFGALAKGYTGDAVMEIFRAHGITSAMINLGGNVQTLGTKPDGSAWRVGITDPMHPEQSLGTVEVTDRAVITSGNYERYFIGEDGRRYCHIIDPATGAPAENGLISVTVIGTEGVRCDALSTALFVEGTAKAAAHWRQAGDFEMICVTEDGRVLVSEGAAADFTPRSGLQTEVLRREG